MDNKRTTAEEILTNISGVEITEDEEVAVTVEESKLDWKEAGKRLKYLVEDVSIDTHYKKPEIMKCRERYNNKDRSEKLFDTIMRL